MESEDSTNILWSGRAIMLVDLDAFFASVEQLDHPQWRGKPVIVGGSADKRGVVSTCSYEARKFGVRSAMPAQTAKRLCPEAIWTSGNFSRYREISNKVMSIMTDESPHIQQVSIDEAFLDVSMTRFSRTDPVVIAKRIQDRVSQLGVTCSIGLGVSKSVAKVASDFDKPRGLTVVYPGREQVFLDPLPTKVMSGIGPVAQKQLADFGITTLGGVVRADDAVLKRIFGKNADMMRRRCLGRDDDEVTPSAPAKSVSNEISFASDLTTRSDIEAAIATVCAKVARRLRRSGLKASSVGLKVRYADRTIHSAQIQLPSPCDDEFEFMRVLACVLDEVWPEGMPVRLVGMQAFRFDGSSEAQASLFDSLDGAHDQVRADRSAHAQLSAATDAVRDRFGETAVRFGREIRTQQNLTGSSSKNPADYKD